MVRESDHDGWETLSNDGEYRQTNNQHDENDTSSSGTFTRRNVLRAGAGVGAGALVFGGLGGAAAAAQEECNGGTLSVNEDFILLDNQWDNPDATQCVWTNEDGSYGWDMDSTGSSGICYPQALIGTKPWGKDTGVPEFPIQCGDVDELTLETEATIDISGGEWDWAEEWWLMEDTQPLADGQSPQYEVMLVLDWGNGHGHGTPVASNLWTDQYGNTIDLWAHYNSGGTSADFYIFRIQGGTPSTNVDLGRINEYMINQEGVDPNLYMTGIELGNEYWGGAVGSTTIRELDVTINGTTYTSGSESGTDPAPDPDPEPDPDPDRVELPATIQAEEYTGAYDTTTGNEGGAYRDGDVDIESTSDPTGGQYNVGWIESGEWLEYEVSVDSETTLGVDARVASDDGGGSFTLLADGSSAASTSFDATGGWQSWTTVDVGQVSLSSGAHTLRLRADASGWNVNYLEFTEDDSNPDPEPDPDPGNNLAELRPSTTSADVGERIVFQVEDTSGSGQWPVELDWDFGDGTTATGWWNAHSYDSPGSYTVSLSATANDGSTSTHEVTISVS